jgi:hypothetical protein
MTDNLSNLHDSIIRDRISNIEYYIYKKNIYRRYSNNLSILTKFIMLLSSIFSFTNDIFINNYFSYIAGVFSLISISTITLSDFLSRQVNEFENSISQLVNTINNNNVNINNNNNSNNNINRVLSSVFDNSSIITNQPPF